MLRALFEKKGNAVWISHLDLMRLFQRAFKRAGLHLKHTQGFNPRPSVSIALPLSVGVASRCELLDFEIEDEGVTCEEIVSRLNTALIDGVRVLQVYEDGRKQKEIALLRCYVDLHYQKQVPAEAKAALEALFTRETLIVQKHSKNGVADQDIIPLVKNLELEEAEGNILRIHTTICCQNPALNPAQLVAAIETYMPEFAPEYVKYCREEVYDISETIFR